MIAQQVLTIQEAFKGYKESVHADPNSNPNPNPNPNPGPNPNPKPDPNPNPRPVSLSTWVVAAAVMRTECRNA